MGPSSRPSLLSRIFLHAAVAPNAQRHMLVSRRGRSMLRGNASRHTAIDKPFFRCPNCDATYHVVKVEVGQESTNREITCRTCGPAPWARWQLRHEIFPASEDRPYPAKALNIPDAQPRPRPRLGVIYWRPRRRALTTEARAPDDFGEGSPRDYLLVRRSEWVSLKPHHRDRVSLVGRTCLFSIGIS